MKTGKPLEVVAFNLMLEWCPHKTSSWSIKNWYYVVCLHFFFSIKAGKKYSSLLDNILVLPWGCSMSTSSTVEMRCTSDSLLSQPSIMHVLRLYYGARCIFSHGNPAMILTEGCLHNFPSVAELSEGLSSKRAAEEFILFPGMVRIQKWMKVSI